MSRRRICERIRGYLPDLATAEISEARREEIDVHLAQCGECRQAAEAVTEVLFHVASRELADPGPEFWSTMHKRVAGEIERAERRTFLRWPVMVPGLAAAAVLLVLLVWWAIPGEDSSRDPRGYFAQMELEAEQSLAGLESELRQDENFFQELLEASTPSGLGTTEMLIKLTETQLERLAERLEGLMG